MRIAHSALLFCAVILSGCLTQKRDTDLIHVEMTKQSCADGRVTIYKTEPAIVAGDTLALMTLEVPAAEKDEMFADGRDALEAGEENRFAKFSLNFSCKKNPG